MVSAAQWRSRRTQKFKAPSGDEYLLCIPDPLTLIDEWRKAGVQTPLDEEDLGEKISQPHVIAHVLRTFVKEPKITDKPTKSTLSIDELMEDQTDSIAIYREILRPFIEKPDEVAAFFRGLIPSSESRPSGTPLSPAANRSTGPNLPGSSRKDHLEPAHFGPDLKLGERTNHRRRRPKHKKGED